MNFQVIKMFDKIHVQFWVLVLKSATLLPPSKKDLADSMCFRNCFHFA